MHTGGRENNNHEMMHVLNNQRNAYKSWFFELCSKSLQTIKRVGMEY